MTPEVDIIIPHHGATPELNVMLFQCLRSIDNCSDPRTTRLILIDNATPLSHKDQIHELCSQRESPSLYVILNNANVGFGRAVAQGLEISTAPYVVIANNDILAMPNWLDLLKQPFLEDKTVGIVGPVTTDGGWQGRYRERNPLGRGWCGLPQGHTMVAFFCAMVSRECLSRVSFVDAHAPFDEFGGFGGDDLYCHRALKAGFTIAIQRDLVIPHRRRTTFRAVHGEDGIQEMQRKALARFNELRKKS